MNTIKTLTRYALYTLLVAVALSSCGNEQAVLNDTKNPFVVKSIQEFSETHASYYNGFNEKSATGNNLFGSWYGRVVLPKGMFNVGDTIVVFRNCN
jgi:hypothetical protein